MRARVRCEAATAGVVVKAAFLKHMDFRLAALMAALAMILAILLVVSEPVALAWATISGFVVYRYERRRPKI